MDMSMCRYDNSNNASDHLTTSIALTTKIQSETEIKPQNYSQRVCECVCVCENDCQDQAITMCEWDMMNISIFSSPTRFFHIKTIF